MNNPPSVRASITGHLVGTPEFDLETAIVDTLPHAGTIGRLENWRYAAREFLRVLDVKGYTVVALAAPSGPQAAAMCGCPVNEAGDIRCHECGEYVNVRCWKCGTKRGDGPCPNPPAAAVARVRALCDEAMSGPELVAEAYVPVSQLRAALDAQ